MSCRSANNCQDGQTSAAASGMGSAASAHNAALPHPRARTEFGAVEGKRHVLRGARCANVFLGVPFARPPVGELRFRRPERPRPWPGALACRRYKRRPVQPNYPWDVKRTGVLVGEDCLYLNIMAPGWTSNEFEKGYPVLVYIHGGGYFMDSAAAYSYQKCSRNFVCRDIVVVTVEYRLGYLGFMCLDEQHMPGNFGMWDQVMALRFIKRNIASFGGDPDNITLSGQSAGAASTDLHSMSPVSRDLFHKRICMAGNAENQWAISDRRLVVRFCREKAIELGFRRLCNEEEWTDEENRECTEYLRSLPWSKLSFPVVGQASNLIQNLRLLLTPVFGDDLFPQHPHQMRTSAPPKPTIIGVCKYEATLFAVMSASSVNERFLVDLENRLRTIVEMLRDQDGEADLPSANAVIDSYGINDIVKQDKKSIRKTSMTIMSDLVNNFACHVFCQKASFTADAKCWRYMFDHINPMLWGIMHPWVPSPGSTHTTELAYVLDVNVLHQVWFKTKTDRLVARQMVAYFANFAKYGDPNGADLARWEPLSEDNPHRQLWVRGQSAMRDEPDWRRLERMQPLFSALCRCTDVMERVMEWSGAVRGADPNTSTC